MKEIDKSFDLFDGEREEILFDKASSSSLYAKRAYKPLPREENRQLAVRAATGDAKALDLMIRHNMGLVHSVARRYGWSNIPIEDLVQEGSIGLLKAIERFDYAQGAAFSTYATWWIRPFISRYVVNHTQTIRLPVWMHLRINKILEVQEELLLEGKDPSDEAVAERLNITPKQVGEALTAMRQKGEISLDQSVPGLGNDGNDLRYIDIIPDSHTPRPEVLTQARQWLEETIRRVKALGRFIEWRFDLCTREIIFERSGINFDQRQKTLIELGREKGVSREWIRKVEVSVWKEVNAAIARRKKLLSKRELQHIVNELGEMEKLAQVELNWESAIQIEARAASKERVEMIQASVREIVSEEETQLLLDFYGIGRPRRRGKDLAMAFGIAQPTVNYRIEKVRRKLKRALPGFDWETFLRLGAGNSSTI